MSEWRFVCPSCGHIQTSKDFEQYKDKGATPSSASFECIGRYSGGNRHWGLKEAPPCDYVAYGIPNICPVVIIDEEDGSTHPVFAFVE